MNKRTFSTVLALSVFLFLLSSQIFVYAAKPAPGLDKTKNKICKLVDFGKLSEAAAMGDKLIADNSTDPNLAKIISNIADYHSKRYNYGRAKALYNRLIQLYPQNDYANQAGLKLVKLDILAMIKSGNAEPAIEQLIANHSGNAHFAGALYDIAFEYSSARQFDKAMNLYRRLIKLRPQDNFAEKAKYNLIKDEIYSKFENGDFAIDGLLTNATSTNNARLPELLYTAANKYTTHYKYGQARALCNQIIQKSPEGTYGRRASLSLKKLDIYEKIDNGDFASAEDLAEKLIAEHAQDKYVPRVLYDTANYYVKCRNYKRARKLYSRLISLYPEDQYSARSDKEIAALDIRSKVVRGEYKSAYKALEKFINKYEKDSRLARTCYFLDVYCWKRCLDTRDYEAVIPIAELIYRRFPEFNHYNARVDVKLIYETVKVSKEIVGGNLAKAQKDIAKIKRDYAGSFGLPQALYFIAEQYSKKGYIDQSYALCDEVINTSEGKYATYCDFHKWSLDVRSLLESGDTAGAKQKISQFKSKYADSPYMQKGLISLVGEFFDKGLLSEDDSFKDYLREAIAMCEAEGLIKADTPGRRHFIYSMLAESFLKLGDFARSASYYQRVADEYPDKAYAWHAQFMAGRAYEEMQQTGAISKEQAAVQIKSAYQKLLQEYPKCKSAKIAQKWLRNHN